MLETVVTWRVADDDGDEIPIEAHASRPGRPGEVFEVCRVDNVGEKGRASATLIAAAPYLLEATRALLESYCDLCRRNGMHPESFEVVQAAEAAVIKAEDPTG